MDTLNTLKGLAELSRVHSTQGILCIAYSRPITPPGVDGYVDSKLDYVVEAGFLPWLCSLDHGSLENLSSAIDALQIKGGN